ncbi:MAG: CRISPR-associated protein Cas4 [Armatimonadetes bacterium]|nr:CRISPR-associated protein Cas4 [Armatimonadota bacterium]
MPERSDDEIVLVSAIEHYSYCPRQCALIHIEKVFDENVFTLRGSMAHARVDQPVDTVQDGVTVERALPIWSEQYGLQGKADVVEFHPDGAIYPVEYKIGGRKPSEHDDLQLCAQAICLEEMLGRPVTRGAVYSGTSRHRREVDFTDQLRKRSLEVVAAIREMQSKGTLPEPVDDARCPNCSLVHVCMPSVASVTTLHRPYEVGEDCNDVFNPTDEEALE